MSDRHGPHPGMAFDAGGEAENSTPAPDFGLAAPPEQLVRLSRLAAIGEMVACFSHEVSNPLMLVQGHLRLVQEQLPEEHPARESVEAALAAARRISQISARMLAFSRKPARTEESCDVIAAVAEAHRFVRPYLRLRSVSFDADFQTARRRSVRADRNLLVQVLVNLFQNAADAMSESAERWIRVRASHEGSRFRIEVADTGRGIPARDLDRIFEPFFSTKGPAGTGLGLYIVRRIVTEILDGSITARSGRGATVFTILLRAEP